MIDWNGGRKSAALLEYGGLSAVKGCMGRKRESV